MKRLNPETQKPFKRHDTRGKDNKVFFAYTRDLKRDGFFKEIWLSPESMAKQLVNNATINRRSYTRKSKRLPRNSASFFRMYPKAKLDYYKLLAELESYPDTPYDDLVEMLDSGNLKVLQLLNVTIPG